MTIGHRLITAIGIFVLLLGVVVLSHWHGTQRVLPAPAVQR